MFSKNDYSQMSRFYACLFMVALILTALGLYLSSCTPKYDESCQKILVEVDGELYPVNEHFLFPPL